MIVPTMPISRTELSPQLQFSHDVRLGDYLRGQNGLCWTHWRQSASGEMFQLCGRSEQPTDEQLALWGLIHSRLDPLVSEAIQTIPHLALPDLAECRHLSAQEKQGALMRFDPAQLKLREVRIENDKLFILFFEAEMIEDWDMFPMVTFESFSITSSEWTV